MDLQLTLVAIGAFGAIGLGLAALILYARAKLISEAPCKIVINDEKTVEVKGGGTLLQALQINGIQIPSPCGGRATCKQCKVRVLSGGGDLLETDRATFSRSQLKQGWRLSCQCKVKHDLKVAIPEELLEIREFEGVVLSNQNVATFIKELVIEIQEPISYRSGAYLQFYTPAFRTNTNDWKETIDPKFWIDWEKFGLFNREIDYSAIPEPVIRAYSFASYPREGNVLKFNIRIATPPIVAGKVSDLPWGMCSSYCFSLKKGDRVRLSGPFGESFMRGTDEELIFLIGGAGSSFGRSHILHLFKTEKTHRKVTLWYGARSRKENIYEQDFQELAKEFPQFHYHLVLSEPLPEDGWPTKAQDPVRTNFLFKAFELGQLKEMKAPENALYFVCGPPLHNAACMKLLDDYGVPRENIVLDDFGS